MKSSFHRINASILSSKIAIIHPLSFFDTYSMSTSSLVLKKKPLELVINFLSCYLVHLSNVLPCPLQEWPRVSYDGDNSNGN